MRRQWTVLLIEYARQPSGLAFDQISYKEESACSLPRRGWQREFDDPIPLLNGRTLTRCGTPQLQRSVAKDTGMAGRDRGADDRDAERADDAVRDRLDESSIASRRSRVQSRPHTRAALT